MAPATPDKRTLTGTSPVATANGVPLEPGKRTLNGDSPVPQGSGVPPPGGEAGDGQDRPVAFDSAGPEASASDQGQWKPGHVRRAREAAPKRVADVGDEKELNAVLKVIVYQGDRILKRWDTKAHWEGPLPRTYRASRDGKRWTWNDPFAKDVKVNTRKDGTGGQAIEGWAGSNATKIIVYAQPVEAVAVDLDAEKDDKAPGLATDKKDAGDGSTTDVKPGDGSKGTSDEKKKDSGGAKADEIGDGTDADGHGDGEMAGEGEEDEGFADEFERELGAELDGDVDDGQTTGKKTGGEKKGGEGEAGGDKDGKKSTDAVVGGEGPGGPDAKADGIEDGQRDAKDNSGTAGGSSRGEKWGSEEGEFGGEGGDEDRGARGAMALFGGLISVPAALRGLVEVALIIGAGDITGVGAAAFKKGVKKAASVAAIRKALAKEARTAAAKETRAIMKQLASDPAFKALSKAEKGQLARITRWELQRKYFQGYLGAARQARREAKAALSRGNRAQRAAAKEREAAAAMGEEVATVQPVAGRLPINHRYAGKEFPRELLPPRYRSKGLKFKETGYPDFSPYAKELPNGQKAVKIQYTGSETGDALAAEAKAGYTATNKAPRTHVWHHNEDLGLMELVPGDLHGAVRHTGGLAGHKHVTGILDYGK